MNYLRNQVILVKPKIIVLLGSVALKHVLGKKNMVLQHQEVSGLKEKE